LVRKITKTSIGRHKMQLGAQKVDSVNPFRIQTEKKPFFVEKQGWKWLSVWGGGKKKPLFKGTIPKEGEEMKVGILR